ncbi:MAG TPA: hypothetical protein VET90_07560 [Candidatus Binatus sp.]|nr:hypothetical protein [Candidatus Binatus sp.]
MRVPKNLLMLIAGGVWILAGGMVIAVGLPLEIRLAPENVALIPLAAVIFVAFYALVFTRLVRKHTIRIRSRAEARLPIYQFFDARSWAIMIVMMGGGMSLRLSHAVPDWAIAFFYSGLGVALFLCGIRFVGAFASRAVLQPVPPDEGSAAG